jgi:hypothetical protein
MEKLSHANWSSVMVNHSDTYYVAVRISGQREQRRRTHRFHFPFPFLLEMNFSGVL